MLKKLLAALIVLALPSLAAGAPITDRWAEQAQERPALDAAVRELCGRQIVLLGENGFHGDGRTVGFKADLVHRLVQSCGFKAVFFEASHYDFVEISRRRRAGEPVTPEMVSSAIGGLWNQNEEVAPLMDFLHKRAADGRLVLGGLDDQLGTRGAFYSLDDMPAELAGYLADDGRETCKAIVRQRIWSDYPRSKPYDEAARVRVSQCLADIRGAVARSTDKARRAEVEQMITAFGRAVARDFDPAPQRIAGRDQSMFQTFQWLAGRLPPGTKIIVWSANSHVGKDARISGIEPNLGSLIHQTYGKRAFAVGFTAASGSYRWNVRTAKEIPVAKPGSLEAMALADGGRDVVYLGRRALAAQEALPAGVLDDHKPVTVRWADVYDAVVVFRVERPPVRRDE